LVITLVSHTKGPQFEPGLRHLFLFLNFFALFSSSAGREKTATCPLLPCLVCKNYLAVQFIMITDIDSQMHEAKRASSEFSPICDLFTHLSVCLYIYLPTYLGNTNSDPIM
jgi:hypothetical protein